MSGLADVISVATATLFGVTELKVMHNLLLITLETRINTGFVDC